MFFAILCLFIAYLIGSFPSALVVGKLAKGIDIREYGSHNLGSTNAIRVLGKKLGFIVFFLDLFKGVLIVGLARILYEICKYQIDFKNIEAFNFVLFKPIYYGLCGVIGHMFPVFAGFRGGKAVAISLGITFVFAPIPAVLCLIVFAITLEATGYVSLSSTFAILTVCISATIQEYILYQYLGKMGIEVLILFYVISVFMIVKHRKNYVRIIKGTEYSFKKKKATDDPFMDDDKPKEIVEKEKIEEPDDPDDAELEIDEHKDLDKE